MRRGGHRQLGPVLLGVLASVHCFEGPSTAPTPTLADGDDGELGALPDAGITTSCRPELDDDCPEGQKCTAVSLDEGGCCVNANRCVPIIGDRGLGEACTRTADNDDCGDRLFCMTESSGSTGAGTCLQMCDWTRPDSCAPQFDRPARCLPLNGGVLPVCRPACDPFGIPCPEGYGCFPVSAYGLFCAPSTPEGTGEDGASCYTISSCAPGLACMNGAVQATCVHDRCCTPICHLSDPLTPICVDGEICVPLFEAGEAPDPALEGVGHCGIEP